jgi:hypothetical protein
MSERISKDAILIFVMLLVYMGFGAVIEHYHVTYAHEAAITIVIGKSKFDSSKTESIYLMLSILL